MKTYQLFKMLNKIKFMDFTDKNTTSFLFCYLVFIIFLIVQHSMVFPYHDDWGYVVLEYIGGQTGFSGHDFKFSHAFSFLTDMYNYWSGRVFSIFLEIYLLKFGFWYARLFQVLAILGILYYSARIVAGVDERSKTYPFVFILPIILYLSLPPEIFIGGIYWFSASSSYLWGVPVFLAAAHSILANKEITLGSSLMLAVSAVFHEQMGCAAIAFFLSYVLYDHFLGSKKQHFLEKIYFSVPLLLLTAATIFAPGNFARKNASAYGSESVYEIILTNIAAISEMFFSQHSIFFWILCLSFISLTFGSSKSFIRSASDFLLPCVTAIVLLSAYFLLPRAWFAICFVGLFFAALLRLCRLSGSGIVVFSIFVASLASLAPLLLAPAFYWRSGIPFHMLLFVPILFSIGAIKEEKVKQLIMSVFAIVFVLASISSANVLKGYHSNYTANILNHYQLVILGHKIKNNIGIEDKVTLFKLPAPMYAETMPYQRPLIEKWIKKYYGVPQEINFEWR